MSSRFEFKSIRKSYGQMPVLCDINLTINPGEFLTFLGPSGSGKTTLLRLAGGFEWADSGGIFLDGRDISYLPPYKRRVNTVFQNYALFPHLSIYENVAFGLRNQRIGKTEIQNKVTQALEMVQLLGYESRFPDQMSGGQQQRVALARALVMQPAVLLLDEPFGALDQKLRKQMQGELKALQRKLRLTFIFVTHDQEEALSLSDRLVILNQGSLEQSGRPEEIYEQPRTRFVAEFMGVQNVFPVKVVEDDGPSVRCWLETGEEILVLKENRADPGARLFAIRPSKIRISRANPNNGARNLLRGHIEGRTYLGDNQIWSVGIQGGMTWIISEPVHLIQASTQRHSLGDEVYLWWESQNGLLVS